MSIDWSHPVAALVGAVATGVYLWLRRGRTFRLDVTIRKDSDPDDDDVR